MSDTVYPLCARCFPLSSGCRGLTVLSGGEAAPANAPELIAEHTRHTDRRPQRRGTRAHAGSEQRNRALIVFLPPKRHQFPQKSLCNSYSSALFSLSGSGASVGIDCQAYCVYHRSTVSQAENTSILGETHALRFPFNLTGIEVEC